MRPGSLAGSFGHLWASSASANLADGMLLAGLPVLATTVTMSPAKVAGVQVAFVLSMGLSALPAGVAADRYARGRVLVVANLVRAMGLLLVLVVGWHDGWQLAAVYAAALLAGSTEVLADVTAETAVHALVPDAGLERAHSRIIGTQVVLNDAVGAPIGGVLATVGMAPLVAVPAALYGLAAAVVSTLEIPSRPVPARTSPASLAGEIAAGARALWRDTALRRLAASNALMNMGNTAFFAVAVLLVLGPLGMGRAAYGLLLAAVAVGGVVGTAGAHRVLVRLGSLPTMVTSRVGAAAAYAVLCVTTSAAVAAVAAVALGATGTLWNVTSRTVRQRLVSGEMLGRVTSTMMVIGIAMAPIGGVLGGVMAEVAGVRSVGVIAVGTTLFSLAALRGIDLTPRPRPVASTAGMRDLA